MPPAIGDSGSPSCAIIDCEMPPARSASESWLRVGAAIGVSGSLSCGIGDCELPDRDCNRPSLLRTVRSANASCLRGAAIGDAGECDQRSRGNRPVTAISRRTYRSSIAISGSLTGDLIDDTAKALVMKKPAKRCWSDLPLDLLEKVFKRLPPLEQFRFRIVCRVWYRATAAVRRNPSPWIVIFHHCNFNGKPRACSLQHLFVPDADGGGHFYDFSIPKDFEGWCCSGSSQGWLFLWSAKHSALLNPITASSVKLPNLLGCSRKKVHRVIISSSPTFSSGYIVAMLFTSTVRKQHIAFWKPGEKDWLWEEPNDIIADVQDILFSRTKTSLFLVLDDELLGDGLWCRFTPCFSDKAIIFNVHLFENLEVFYCDRKRLVEMEEEEAIEAFGLCYDHFDKDEVLVSRRGILELAKLDTMSGKMKIGSLGYSAMGSEFSESLISSPLVNQSDERDFIYTVERSRRPDCFRWGIYSMRTRSFLHTSCDITLPKKRKCCSGSKITTPKKKKYYLGSNPSIEVAWFIPSFS